MKCYRILAMAAAALAFCACTENTKEGYTINGKITNPKLDGRTVYMIDAFTGEKFDSAQVKGMRFKFEGVQKEPVVRELMVKEGDDDMFPVTLPIVLENGNITAEMGNLVYVADTKLNDVMMEHLMAKDKYMDELMTKKMSADSVKADFAQFIVREVLKNGNTVVGKYIFNSYKSKLNEEQIIECSKLVDAK